MPKKSKTPRTKKPKGKTVITQKVIVNVSKRGTSKPRGPPQPSQAERLFQLMAQSQRLLQPAQPLQPSLSQLQQLLKPTPPIIIQGVQGPQGPQGPTGLPGLRPSTSEAGTQSSPSTAEKATQRRVETTSVAIGEDYIATPTAKPLVEPPHAQVDTTPQPLPLKGPNPSDSLPLKGPNPSDSLPISEPSSEEDEEMKYEEEEKPKRKRPQLKKPEPGEAKAVPTNTQDWMSLFTEAGEIDTTKLQKLPEKRKANTTAPITLREVAKTLGITVPRDKANKADVVQLIIDYYKGASKPKA